MLESAGQRGPTFLLLTLITTVATAGSGMVGQPTVVDLETKSANKREHNHNNNKRMLKREKKENEQQVLLHVGFKQKREEEKMLGIITRNRP